MKNNQSAQAQSAKYTGGEWYNDNGSIMTKIDGVELQLALISRTRFCGKLTASEEAMEKMLQDTEEVNARLIASAPLMLRALEAVLEMGDDYEAEKLVRQAIKQAKGE